MTRTAQHTHERFEITRNGRPAAVLLGIDDAKRVVNVAAAGYRADVYRS